MRPPSSAIAAGSGLGAVGDAGSGTAGSSAMTDDSTSSGRARTTGPGRPLQARAKARFMYSGMRSGALISKAKKKQALFPGPIKPQSM